MFVNKFNGYIFEQATGDEEDGLPVFAYVQRGAKLYGSEIELTFHLHESKSFNADLRLFADSVRATNTTDGTPLPRTTPVRFGSLRPLKRRQPAITWLALAAHGVSVSGRPRVKYSCVSPICSMKPREYTPRSSRISRRCPVEIVHSVCALASEPAKRRSCHLFTPAIWRFAPTALCRGDGSP